MKLSFKIQNEFHHLPETFRKHLMSSWSRSIPDVFIVNFEHVSNLVLVFLLLTLSKCMLAGMITAKLTAWKIEFSTIINWLMSQFALAHESGGVKYRMVFHLVILRNLSWHYVGLITLVPSLIFLFKLNNGNTRTMCEMCLKLAIKTQKRGFPLLTLNMWILDELFIIHNYLFKANNGLIFDTLIYSY